MKTKSFFAIAIEAVFTVSLIAVLVSLLIFVYIVLAIFTVAATQATTAPQIIEPTTQVLPAAQTLLAPTIYAMPPAKQAPKLEPEKKAKTVTPPETETIDYAKMTVKQLKPLARDRKIPNWTKLNKKDLIAALSA